ncbi:MAG TPA: D-glycero-beta-D-manno-heptose 1-phosphate adenylyltransferase [Glaciihabitans sp.]|jgi:rfaE bifunctional protein kinase chain/domain/rfaE bifunctional protein nucleotidyltransferase chain/domain|nr:D-glycero-beta-D-manno-heptose 1-phosphate adenylyltransferase [Glaciihabitans sp.]
MTYEPSGDSSLLSISPDFVAAIASRRPRVAVIGDAILDRWWTGTTVRISREAPAPVVDLTNRSAAPGGAANTAVNLAALGAQVSIVGVVGADEAGHELRIALHNAGVDVRHLLELPDHCTTTKTRVVSGDQILLRIDEQHSPTDGTTISARLAEEVRRATEGMDAEIIADYGTGDLGSEVLAALVARPTRPPLTVVDAHDAKKWKDLAPTIATPNAEETEKVLGITFPGGRSRAITATSSASALRRLTGAQYVVVTLDRDGTVTLDGKSAHRTFAHPTSERLASGAGDTFVSALTVAVASGASITLAADFAQLAADVAVQRDSTSVCTADDLIKRLTEPPDPSLTADQLEDALVAHRAAGQRIVFTNGCFDVLHRGHTASLRQAKALGGVLVVAINSDNSVRRLKGPERPINSSADRATVVAALDCVDYVTVFDSDTPVPLIERLHPDVYAKGGDYTPEMLAETPVVQSYGGRVQILDYVSEHSTTETVNRIRGGLPSVEHSEREK